MSHKRKGSAIYEHLQVGKRPVETPSELVYVSTLAKNRQQLAGAFMQEQLIFESASLTVVDSGGASGGWVSEKILTPPSRYVGLAGFLEVEVESVGAGIASDGDVYFGVGSAAATAGSLSGTSVDLVVVNTVSLTAGAGGPQAVVGPLIPKYVDITSTPDIYFSVGVADADISADAAVTFNATVRLFLLDLAGA